MLSEERSPSPSPPRLAPSPLPAAISPSPSPPARAGWLSPPAPPSQRPLTLRLTSPQVSASSSKRKRSKVNERTLQYERPGTLEQDSQWQGYMNAQSDADMTEGLSKTPGRAPSKKRKNLSEMNDQSNRVRIKPVQHDENMMIDHLEPVSRERDGLEAKDHGKRRTTGEGNEHIREPDSVAQAVRVDFRPSSRPRPVKTRRKEQDGNLDRAHDYGRRSAGSDNKDTTGDEDVLMRVSRRKPLVSPKASAAKVKRPPAKSKHRPTVGNKASATAVATTSIADDLEAQRTAPVPGPTENAVRGHCLGKLENAFINVFLTFFRALLQNGQSGDNMAINGIVPLRNSNREDSGDGDLMEVDPPIRITEPIVLDHDDVPQTNAAVLGDSCADPLEPTDSGGTNPVSSSIEIVNASQQSVEHTGNGNASQPLNTAVYVNTKDGTIDEPRIIDDALTYAQEVEAALFNKLKQFSREKRLWLPGFAYKQQYTLILSSLEGDLRPDLREGFATRRVSPTEVASMTFRDLASLERLKEMQMYEEEALKSLVRIDDGRPAKAVKDGADNGNETTQEVSIPRAIHLDMIVVDVDENESTSIGQQEIRTQADHPHSNGSKRSHDQSLLDPTSITHSARSNVTESVIDPDMPRWADTCTPSPHSPTSPGVDDVLEEYIQKYYDNNDGALWASTSSKQSARFLTENEFKRTRKIWQGEIYNPADEGHPRTKVYARQAGGPDYSLYPGVWSLIFPSETLNLVGRVTTDASVKYITQNLVMVHRELIMVAFSPAGDDEKSKADFESLVDFHHSRDRHGRIMPWSGIEPVPPGASKEMYLVPLKPDETFDFLDLMPESVLPKTRRENFLLGIFLIAKTGNHLFPPEVLQNHGSILPVTTSSVEGNADTNGNPASSRPSVTPSSVNVDASQTQQLNGTNDVPAPPIASGPPPPP
ncbi:hypothetical protein QFC19_002694 [Naganishia cerealis]|uniref:Uncharacterized protein n=1 Tax=Naganishia cerealis TaxID=610337 RepID=A0ACC2WAR7_9TREE|nr:hypothetical protein QFC19_002694 [Naganishia cerealis]